MVGIVADKMRYCCQQSNLAVMVHHGAPTLQHVRESGQVVSKPVMDYTLSVLPRVKTPELALAGGASTKAAESDGEESQDDDLLQEMNQLNKDTVFAGGT